MSGWDIAKDFALGFVPGVNGIVRQGPLLREFAMRKRCHYHVAVAGLALLGASTSCGEPSASAGFDARDRARAALLAHVTGAAAAQVGPDGLFQLTAPTSRSGQPEITEARARELARAFIRTFAEQLSPTMQSDHGGPIDMASLVPCGRVYYAESAFEPLPLEVPRMYHRVYGSWWLVTFCGPGNVRQVSLAVSALATDLGIRADGLLAYPPESGGAFVHPLGIPRREFHRALPVEPERAVELVARLTGRRVAEPPRLITPGPHYYPQTARWRLALDARARVPVATGAGGQAIREVAEAYNGVTLFAVPPTTAVAAPAQPEAVEFSWRPPFRPGMTDQEFDARPRYTSRARRRADMPIVFEPVTTTPGGRL
jgi:hypothetical protein